MKYIILLILILSLSMFGCTKTHDIEYTGIRTEQECNEQCRQKYTTYICGNYESKYNINETKCYCHFKQCSPI